jgi:catechol 2,3-dioxygenase-like lactoylglutathione lyase family enzyme
MRIPVDRLTPLLQVFDMPTAVAFYRDLLGFEVAASSNPRSPDDFDWCLLARDGVELMLNTAYEHDSRPPAPDPARVAAHKDTALFIACPDVDAAHAMLRAKGVTAGSPTIASYGMKQLYLRDPDGYEICLQWPATREPGA